MAPRRDPSQHIDSERLMARIDERLSALAERVDGSIDRAMAELSEVKSEVRRGGFQMDNLGRRLADAELQINQARDDIQRAAGVESRAAAEGAAAGAAKGAAIGAGEVAAKVGRKLNPFQWGAILGIALLWLTSFVEKGPAIMRAVIAFAVGLAKLDGKG